MRTLAIVMVLGLIMLSRADAQLTTTGAGGGGGGGGTGSSLMMNAAGTALFNNAGNTSMVQK